MLHSSIRQKSINSSYPWGIDYFTDMRFTLRIAEMAASYYGQ